jgi:hypothetical protein
MEKAHIKLLDHVRAAPCLLQEQIAKSLELRVTVVASEVFACAMDTQASPRTRCDYRKYDFERVQHTRYYLPEEIEKRCRRLVRNLGLYFASMDLILTPSGEFVFLDLNPNGQWLWTEELAELPISLAIARLLADPPHAS